MNDLVSIIVPVYNVEKYLNACMISILNQTYANIEIILIDDGSKDNSGVMCDEYANIDSRVKVIHKKNGGLSDARNTGILKTNGKYIMFIDSDDVVASNYVEYLYTLLIENNADIAICDVVHCYPNKKIAFEQETSRRVFMPEEAIEEMLYQKNILVSACGKIYKRKLFDRIFFPQGMLFEDSAVMYKIFDQTNIIAFGNAKLYGYLHRDDSITTQEFSKRDEDILIIAKQIVDYMSERDSRLQRAATAYELNANMRVYLNAPEETFGDTIQGCKSQIRRHYLQVFFNPNIRSKLRGSLVMFLFGRKLMKKIYAYVDRWA